MAGDMTKTHLRKFYDPTAPAQANQMSREFVKLLAILRRRQPTRCLEIGVFTGGSLYQFLQCMPGGYLVAVDLPGGAWGMEGSADPQAWKAWGEERGVRVIPILSHSQTRGVIGAVHSFAPYDFIFIDADHSYAGAKADWETYHYMVRPGGIIALHDILPHPHDNQVEVWRLWDEIKAEAGIDYRCEELVSDENQTEMGIGLCLF
jgi:predicted O-methyltransferase YrrM